MSARVAVAVVSWNTRELLSACLDSLAADADAGLASVWVVDNGSSDGSPEMVSREFSWVRLIEPGENLGFGRAVNLVAERSEEPWIAPANADLQLRAGALGRLLEAGERYPEAGALVPRLLMPDGRTQHSVHSFPRVRLGVALQSGATSWVPGLGDRLMIDGRWNPNRAREVEWAHGAFMLVRRRAFLRSGGFDPAQWMYAEDIDICWRLRENGWSIRYEPESVIGHHVAAATSKAFAGDRERRHLTAGFDWMAKRQGLRKARAYACINSFGSGIRAIALWLPARLVPSRFAHAQRRYAEFAKTHGALALRRPRGSDIGDVR